MCAEEKWGEGGSRVGGRVGVKVCARLCSPFVLPSHYPRRSRARFEAGRVSKPACRRRTTKNEAIPGDPIAIQHLGSGGRDTGDKGDADIKGYT